MLSAILYGKKTGTGLAGTRLKIGETQGSEDVLTASVFERIAYLPNDVFKLFIQNLLGNNDFGCLDEIRFWPKLELRHSSVEPDVVLYDQTRQVIIVEAKRYDGVQQQYASQLAHEILAIWQSGEEIGNPILLAVGGMGSYSKESINIIKKQIDNILLTQQFSNCYQLYMKSWQDVYLALEAAIENDNAPVQRLLADIREAYFWHGIRYKSRQWLQELKRQHLKYAAFPNLIGKQHR